MWRGIRERERELERCEGEEGEGRGLWLLMSKFYRLFQE